jgi:DNA-binding response OmpR family regulator
MPAQTTISPSRSGSAELQARIRVALRRGARDADGTQTAFEFGGVRVDLARAGCCATAPTFT